MDLSKAFETINHEIYMHTEFQRCFKIIINLYERLLTKK